MEREQAQPSAGKEVQTQTIDKEKADKNSDLPKIKTIISSGYIGPYAPLNLRKAIKEDKSYTIRVFDGEEKQ